MNLQFIDIGCDVVTFHLTSKCNLLHREQGSSESSCSSWLQYSAGLEAFPGTGYLDAHSSSVEYGIKVFEKLDNPWLNVNM